MKQEKTRILSRDGVEVEAFAPVVLSVSRSTDIPAFYSEWFFNRIEEGYCRWRNPFNGTDSYVSFQDVRFIVFWSKNPAPLLPYLERLRERESTAMFSILSMIMNQRVLSRAYRLYTLALRHSRL